MMTSTNPAFETGDKYDDNDDGFGAAIAGSTTRHHQFNNLQSVEEGEELHLERDTDGGGTVVSPAQKSSAKKSKKKRKSSSSKKKEKRSSQSSSQSSNSNSNGWSINEDSNTTSTSLMSDAIGDWPEEQQEVWKFNSNVGGESTRSAWQHDLASVGGVSTWTSEDQVTSSVVSEQSLDPQRVFQKIDRHNTKQRKEHHSEGSHNSTSFQSSRGSLKSSTKISPDMQQSDPSLFVDQANLKRAPSAAAATVATGEDNFVVQIPVDKWEAFEQPQQQQQRKVPARTEQWEDDDVSAFVHESPVAPPRASLTAAQPAAAVVEPVGQAMMSYLLSMGYSPEKSQLIADGFAATQQQQQQQQHRSNENQTNYKAPSSWSSSAVAAASKLKEMETNNGGSNTAHHRQQLRPASDQSVAGRSYATSLSSQGGSNAAEAASTTVQTSVSTDAAPPRQHRTTSRNTTPRNSGNRRGRRRPVPMYERFQKPGAVEMDGRAFGAPYRPSESASAQQQQQAAVATVTTPDEEIGGAILATTVDDDNCKDPSKGGDYVTVVASPLSLTHALKERSLRRVILCGLLFMVLVVVAGTVSYILLRSDDESQNDSGSMAGPTLSPSSAPTFINDAILEAAMSISGMDEDLFLRNETSPQLQAVGWLSSVDQADDDNFGPSFLQRYVLVVFYFSTYGADWINRESWLHPTLHVCDWSDGIKCRIDSTNRQVIIGLDVTRNGLAGVLPNEIGQLRALEHLKLPKNKLGGSIPASVSALTRMGTLDLSFNRITGSLPSNVGRARDLVVLDVSHNRINGSIPESLYDLGLLRTLSLSYNQISGPVLDMVSNLKVLATLDLRHNKISGTLASGFDELKALDFFWVDYNEITGTMMALSANMGNILELTTSHNRLEGPIPMIDGRRSLQDGNADYVFRLQKIDMSHNQYTGTITPLAAFIPTLRYLDFSGNKFTGEFPGNYGWPAIEFMAGADNMFTGTFPLGYPPSLQHLDFSGNLFTNGVPDTICRYPDLGFVDLSDNEQLNGTIPDCIGSAFKLRHLGLANTNLQGTLTSELGLLSELEFFNMSHNVLSSTIPSEIVLCSDLNTLDVSSNDFVSSIPSELGNLRFLRNLDLSDNRLTGTIPQGFGRLTKLETFAVGGNDLIGILPTGLCDSQVNLTTTKIGCNVECSCCHETNEDCVLGM